MRRNLAVIVLIAIILTLLIPLTTELFSIERAFTPDNFIRLNVVSR